MYYKIITPASFFSALYKDTDVFNIPSGKIFTAPQKPKYKPDTPKYMLGQSCFHFSEGAFDTMLWHTLLIHHTLPAQIYEIAPLTNIKKQRCNDSDGIYQCAAHQIKFLEKQNIDEMYDRAINEYDPNRYKNFRINIDLWKKHEPTVFILYNSYKDSLPNKKYPPIPLDRLVDLMKKL